MLGSALVPLFAGRLPCLPWNTDPFPAFNPTHIHEPLAIKNSYKFHPAVGFPRIGKKWFLLALSLPFVAGWLIILFADNYAMLLVGRFLTGSFSKFGSTLS